VDPLNAEEAQLAGDFNLESGPLMRAWEYWSVRLDKAEGNWKPAKAKSGAAKSRRTVVRKSKRNRR
jgi:hypothetical protein